jgi:hypothetical protein
MVTSPKRTAHELENFLLLMKRSIQSCHMQLCHQWNVDIVNCEKFEISSSFSGWNFLNIAIAICAESEGKPFR